MFETSRDFNKRMAFVKQDYALKVDRLVWILTASEY